MLTEKILRLCFPEATEQELLFKALQCELQELSDTQSSKLKRQWVEPPKCIARMLMNGKKETIYFIDDNGINHKIFSKNNEQVGWFRHGDYYNMNESIVDDLQKVLYKLYE